MIQRFVSRALTVVAMAVGLTAAPTHDAVAAGKRFGETVEVLTVQIPVQVVRNGQPVRGLTLEDFEVLEGRKRRPITALDVVDLGAPEMTAPGSEAAPTIPLAARRHFLLLFDLSFAQPDGVVKAREAAREMMRSSLHPSDLVGVATYSLSWGPDLVLGFTSDRGQLEAALDDLGLLQRNAGAGADPLAFMVSLDGILRSPTDPSLVDASQGGSGALPGNRRHLQDLQRMHFEDLIQQQFRVDRTEAISQVRNYTRSFQTLADSLNAVRGRKQVLLFSEGFDASAILGTASAERQIANNRSAENGEYWKVDSEERFGSTSTLSFLDDMLEAFRRSDTVIQAIDIGGARTSARADATGTAGAGGGNAATLLTASSAQMPAAPSENSLFVMANETGGELYRNWNDLSAAVDRLLDRTSVTYVLSFDPGEVARDGRFHPVKIRLKNAPRGTRLLHRPGYYAPTPYRDKTALQRQLETADLVLDTADGGAIDVATWATTTTVGPDGSEVMFFLDVDGASLLEGQEHDLARFRVFAYALDRAGQVGDFMSQGLELDLDRVEDAIERGGVTFFGKLRLPPGTFRIRTIFQDVYNGRYGARTTRVTVPGADDPRGPRLVPPLFALASGDGLLLVENDTREAATEYPLDLGETAFVPRMRLAVDEAVAVLVAAYDAADAALEVWLEDERGQRLEGGVTLTEPLTATEDASWRARLAVDAATLDAGTYRLQVSVGKGTQRATRHTTLVVGGG